MVNKIRELFSRLHGGASPTHPHELFGLADKLGGGGYGTSRAGTEAFPQSVESRGMGASHGEDGVGEVPEKALKKVGDGHLSGRMLNARDAPSAELERLRLMIPKRRSTTRKKGRRAER